MHVKIGKTALVIFPVAYIFGLIGIRDLGYPAYSTPHGYFDTFTLALFLLGGAFALLVLRGKLSFVKYHRTVMIIVAILIFLQILGGIGNLIDFRILEF